MSARSRFPWHGLMWVAIFAAPLFLVASLLFPFKFELYFPRPLPPGALAQLGLPQMKPVEVETADGLKLAAWFAPPRDRKGRIVVHFHGNGDNLASAARGASLFLDRNLGLMLCEYRGYGGNPGTPSEEGLYADARACLGWLKSHGYRESQLALYGFSLGTAVAVQMATETAVPLMVLEASFSHVKNLTAAVYGWLPVHLFIPERYDSLSKIGRTKTRLLMVHGAKDDLLPPRHARRLFAAAPEPKEFILIDGAGHNDLSLHGATERIAGWIARSGD
jgi:uncharacterized protein